MALKLFNFFEKSLNKFYACRQIAFFGNLKQTILPGYRYYWFFIASKTLLTNFNLNKCYDT